MPNKDTVLIGVYGTLKSGEPNHELLSESKFVGLAYTLQQYSLADLLYYPGLIKGGYQAVRLELYEVTTGTLSRLDRLEGHPSLFIREEIPVITEEFVNEFTHEAEVKLVNEFTHEQAIVYLFNRYKSQPLYKEEDLFVSWSSK